MVVQTKDRTYTNSLSQTERSKQKRVVTGVKDKDPMTVGMDTLQAKV